ncbi:hypothetical protein M0R45_008220 [Rubus argutus]|uniref:Uncharacterized protein n=1 Tax=Rubus argutus TaxID=59490 RepID=A0AAW1Y0L7_RUBAR
MQNTLRTAHGITFVGPNIIPEWFNYQSINSSISVRLPELYTKSRPWIAYTLYADFVVLGDVEIGCDFKLMHKFDFFYNTKNGLHHKHTLSHELIVKDVQFTGSNGYWIYIPHLWFSQQLIDLNECSSIESHTRVDSTTVEVKMTGARLLYQQDFEGFVQAIKWNTSIVRIRKNMEEHSGGEIKSTLKEQGGEFTSTYSDSSRTHLSIYVEDQGRKIDSTISLRELLESLPLECNEGRWYAGVKYYFIKGKFTNPQTALMLEKIIQEYSGQHLRYSNNFIQSEIPESFYCVQGSLATFTLNAYLDSTIGWKGIAFCVSVAVDKHPSLILDDFYSENPYIIEGILENSTNWKMRFKSEDFKFEACGLKRVGLIWIYYMSRGSFSKEMLNGCTSMHVRFSPNNKDLTILNCGHQVVFHQNVDELVETIMLCSRNSTRMMKKAMLLPQSTDPVPTNIQYFGLRGHLKASKDTISGIRTDPLGVHVTRNIQYLADIKPRLQELPEFIILLQIPRNQMVLRRGCLIGFFGGGWWREDSIERHWKIKVASALLAELAMEAGLPKGVLNVHGTNDIVNAICDDDDIRAVSFVVSNTESLVVGGH